MKFFWWWAGGILGIEILSFVLISHPLLSSIAAIIFGVFMLWCVWKRPEIALGMLGAELLIGSKGYLLHVGMESEGGLSLRILLTLAFLMGWTLEVLFHRRFKEIFRLFQGRRIYVVLAGILVFAFVRGWLLGKGSNVIQDANAWGDWILLFPVLDIVSRSREKVRQELPQVFFVAFVWLAFETLILEYFFSHGFSALTPSLYLWIRRTGVGEITFVQANAFRIFFQSHVYAVAAGILGAAWWMMRPAPSIRSLSRHDRLAWIAMLFSTVVLGISLSRSFWMGGALGVVCLIIILLIEKVSWWKRLIGPLTALIFGVGLIGGTLAFPLPPVNVASLGDVFGSRASLGEAAAASRWNLLPVLWHKIKEHPVLGSGFGATVTYQTKDPRILKDHLDGWYTTYAFEWGWLEHWIKFGLIGVPLILILLVSLSLRVWRLNEPLWLRAGYISSLVALAGVHIFTPYLNHPLGFLFLFVGEGMVALNLDKNS